MFIPSTQGLASYIAGTNQNYCASNYTSDPCLYYICGTSICVSCQTTDLTYLVAIDTNTTVCGTVESNSQDSSAYSCVVTDNFYSTKSYYESESFLKYLTLTQECYCVDQDFYYETTTGIDTCGDTSLVISSTNVIEDALDVISIGCNECTVSGYQVHSLANVNYYEEFYTDSGTNFISFSSYPLYGQFYIRTCSAGTDGAGCSRTEYYDSLLDSCLLCACKFDYCLYCNSTTCLIYDTSLSSDSDYTTLIAYSCTVDPCSTYETGTNNCEDCASGYGYLFVDSNNTICATVDTYTDGQIYCYVDNNHYTYQTYFGNSYNATASAQTTNTYCVACDYYNLAGTTDMCSDSCANSAPLTSTEEFINQYSVGCGICKTGYKYQQLTQVSFLTDDVYIRSCAAPTLSGSCDITEYYDPNYNVCKRCACKFADCAACSYSACVLYDTVTIATTNCTYDDPCLSYVTGSTTQCIECISSTVNLLGADGSYHDYTYKLMFIDTDTTICATFGLATYADIDSDRYLCDVQDNFYQYESYYGLQYYAQGLNNYCIACDLYFTDSSGDLLCSDSCENIGTSLNYLERSVTSYSVGCGTCSNSDYLMHTVTEVSFISDLYLLTCEANVNGVYCTSTQYYDTVKKQCVSCDSVYSNCAACNSTQCLICAEEFYYSTQKTYNYSSSAFVTTSQCTFQTCPVGQGIITSNSQTCEDCGITNCHSCNVNASDTTQILCNECSVGYYLDTDELGCTAKTTTQKVVTYFINSGGAYDTSNTLLSSYYSSAYGSSPTTPYYFIQQALYTISQLSLTYTSIDATIYLGKGDHFFFFCDALQTNGNSLTEYCDSDNYPALALRFLKAQLYTDDITLSVVALECSLSTTLGISTAAFTSMCVDLDTDSKPVLYLNQPHAYFTLYGSSSFTNLKFSGINQFATASSTSYQLSTLPLLYCQPGNDPDPTNRTLTLVAQTITSFPIDFTCEDTTSAEQNIPSFTNSTATCDRNSDDYFYPDQESTLAATGEPDKSDFFYQGDTFVKTNSGVQPLRRNTLFNIQTFAEYKSSTNEVPALTITNCEFEYFLDSYESLVNVDNNQIQNITYTQTYNGASYSYGTEDWEFFVTNGGERGAKISIVNSDFSHSKFTKGMVVYRKQPYINNTLGLSNRTYMFMTNAFVNDAGSYISMTDSSFYNLNFLSNVTALAISGGSEVKEAFYNYLGTTTVEYQAFMHKGIVLNIEDYGGVVEIKNCSFLSNLHFIPEILISNHTKIPTKNLDSFKDSALTKEYKMSYCSQNSYTDRYFFQNGISQSDDIDSYYDKFERLSLLYMSRNRGSIIIRDNNFTQNMATFGGAISINTMNKQQDTTKALVVIYNNTFLQNMAYFSGNAVYMRMTKNSSNMNATCGGGVLVQSNLFYHNIGMKTHNGGALSAVCTIIDSTHQDFNYSSSLTVATSDQLNYYYTLSDMVDSQTYIVPTYQFSILSSDFDENFSGLKGTAIYLRYISYGKISKCNFIQNGPVFSFYELQYSPYYEFFSDRTITYYDENQTCWNEIAFLTNCNSKNNYIDFSHIQGAVYVEHCQEAQCMNSSYTATVEISLSKFQNNQAGPVLDNLFPNNLASSIYISGGFSNLLTQLQFVDSSGIFFAYYAANYSQQIVNYFPPNYFYSQQAPLVTIEVNPDADLASQTNYFLTNITTCNFKNNKHYQVVGLSSSQQYAGSLINYISQYGQTTDNYIPVLTIQRSTFTDNQIIGPYASLVHAYNGVLNFNLNQAINNGKLWSQVKSSPTTTFLKYNPFSSYSISMSQMYGIVKIQGDQDLPLYHTLQNNLFQYSFSEFGSVYSLHLENQYAKISSNKYQYNFASKQGSVLHGVGTTDQSLIFMNNEQIQYQFNLNGTIGVTSNNNQKMSIIINNTQFSQFYGQQGSAINLYKAQKVILNNCQFQNIPSVVISNVVTNQFYQYQNPLSFFIDSASYASLIGTTSQQGSIYIEDVDGSDQNSFQDILTQNNLDQYASHVEVNNCQFTNLFASAASVFYATNSKLKYINDLNSNMGINSCSHNSQGAIYMESNSEFVGQNLIVTETSSTSSASVLHLSKYSKATISSSKFTRNSAAGQALAFVEGSSSLTCTSCTFDSNYGGDSAILFADNNPDGSIHITQSTFTNNTSINNLFIILYTQMALTHSVLTDNVAQKVQNGFSLVNSKLLLNNISVSHTKADYLSTFEAQTDGGFLSAVQQSDVTIQNSVFKNVRGKSSAVVFASDGTNVKVEKNTQFLNCSTDTGSVLSMDSTGDVNISESHFIGTGFHDIMMSNGNATILSNKFVEGSKNSIHGMGASLQVISNFFSNGSNPDVNGKAVYCTCLNLTIVENVFQNLSSVQGGAIFVTSSSKDSVFGINNNLFFKNKAQQGGALYIQDAPKLVVFNNSFQLNLANVITPETQTSQYLTAKGQGGAIYYNCDNLNQDLSGNCKVSIGKNNKFVNNRAEHDGGAIQWTKNMYIDDETNDYINNTALYGTNVGSYPSSLSVDFVSNNDYYDSATSSTRRRLGDVHHNRRVLSDTGFSKIVSGVPFEFVIYLMDQAGDDYSSDNSSVAELTITYNDVAVTVYNNIAIASDGMYNFSNAVVFSSPGATLYMSIAIAGIEDYGNDISFVQTPVSLPMVLRSCVSGEEVSADLSCTVCPSGTYSYYSDTDGLSSCLQCDSNSLCFGANSTAPQDGYWRANSTGSTFVQCPRVESCLQGDADHPTGICATGYMGPFCAQCEVDYTRSNNYECKKCANKTRSVIQILFIFLFAIFFALFLIKAALSFANKLPTLFQQSMKIMVNHFQIIGAIALIYYNWPIQIDGFFEAQVKLAWVSDDVYSFDCFLQGTQFSEIVGLYYAKLILYGISPFFILMCSFIFWTVYCLIKRSFNSFKDGFICSAIVLLYLILPTICIAMFSGLSCLNVDGEYYLRDDFSITCYQGSHIIYIFALILPNIILWIIGVPFISVIFLINNKDSITKSNFGYEEQMHLQVYQTRIKYGFLFRGYKNDLYFWEVLNMYKKIFIIMIAIFLANYSQECQVLVVLVVLVLHLIFHSYYHPWINSKMNRLDLYSQIVILITIYCGLFYITGQHYTYMDNTGLKWFFLVCIVIPNVIYYGYWIFLMSLEVLIMIYLRNKRLFRLLTFRLINEQKFHDYVFGAAPSPGGSPMTFRDKLGDEVLDNFEEQVSSQNTVQHNTVRDMVEGSQLLNDKIQSDLNEQSIKKAHRKMYNKFIQQNNLVMDENIDMDRIDMNDRIKRYEAGNGDRLVVSKENRLQKSPFTKHAKKDTEDLMLNEDWMRVELENEFEGEEFPANSINLDSSLDASTDKDEITMKIPHLNKPDVSTDQDVITKKVPHLLDLSASTDKDNITKKLVALVEGKVYEEEKETREKTNRGRQVIMNIAETHKNEDSNSEPSVWVYQEDQDDRKLEVDHQNHKILSVLRNVEDDQNLLDRD